MRLVVCSVGAVDHRPFELPASLYADRPRIAGGERTLYELAVAAACAGHDVELRGLVSRPVLDELVAAAGLDRSRAPAVELPPRPAIAEDVVVVPEGDLEPLFFVPAVLSPARAVLMLLGPPGMYGWSFVDRPRRVDPLTMELDAVGRDDQLRAIAALGFELWSNSPGLAGAAQAAGVECRFLGTGTPVPAPAPVEKTHDVAVIEVNRWTPLARSVAEELGPAVSTLFVGELADRTLAASIAPARVLIWPSRIEGDSRIQREARSVGTVPVALATNRFAAQLDEEGGAVVVPTVGDLAPAVRALLDDPGRWAELSRRAMDSARAQVDWTAYVARVDAAVRAAPPDPARFARGAMAGAVDGVLADAERRLAEVDGERHAALGELQAAREVIADREAVLAGVVVELERLRAEQAELRVALDASRARLAEADAAIEAAAARAAAVEAEVTAFRQRRAVRIADGLVRRRRHRGS